MPRRKGRARNAAANRFAEIWTSLEFAAPQPAEDLLALDEALDKLAAIDLSSRGTREAPLFRAA